MSCHACLPVSYTQLPCRQGPAPQAFHMGVQNPALITASPPSPHDTLVALSFGPLLSRARVSPEPRFRPLYSTGGTIADTYVHQAMSFYVLCPCSPDLDVVLQLPTAQSF